MSRSEKYYGPDFNALEKQDPEIAAVVISELVRQRKDLQLIASENFTSPAVLATMGSSLSNKYAEGYPGKRYYGGCEEVDKVEVIGIERAKKLFGAEHANLQPHSGASANVCSGATAYPSLIDFEKVRQICDEVGAIMWVDAAHFIGLVAGKAIPSPVPYADVVSFTTHKVLRGPRGGMILSKEKHAAAIDKAVFPGMQGGPIMSAVAGKAVALKECATVEYQNYAKKVIENCQELAKGLEAAGMRAVSGGTQTHLALIDIRSTKVNGKIADERCGRSGLSLNKNAIPYDPETPAVTSGIRVGTAAITTQGMGKPEMNQIATFIARAIKDGEDDSKAKAIRAEVHQLTAKFPVYPEPKN
ncbi:MAG: serine hydroxymethyltransferase [Actinobacteria bacterium]|nr:serine hydroxymethyltransferase [Actinomycetota bacterium]